MDQFIRDLASRPCQKTLKLQSDVVALAAGIAVMHDTDRVNWLLFYDTERWERRSAAPWRDSRSIMLVLTEHFSVGIITNWACMQAERADETMRQTAIMMLTPVPGSEVIDLNTGPVIAFPCQSSRS